MVDSGYTVPHTTNRTAAMTEPRTEAGKALMRFMGWGPAWAKKILAIEREAAALVPQQDRAAPQPTTLFEAVQMEPLYPGAGAGITLTGPEVTRMLDYRSRILAIVAEATAPGAAAVDRIDVERLARALAGQDLYHGRYGTFPAGHATAAAIADVYGRLTARAAEPKPPESTAVDGG